ncbi:MAG: hypothetical protein J5780_02920, partial [Treponema sp.]|nr:hypothetical protein [Treponema sp.]
NVNGLKKVEGGLVHRIDTETEGLLLAASTQQAFDFFIEEQKNGGFKKEYAAVCRKVSLLPEGFDSLDENSLESIESSLEEKGSASFSVTSRFRAWGRGSKEVRPVFEWSNTASRKKCSPQLYTTDILLKKEGGIYRASCMIKKGFRHQVRAHLCAAFFPIAGDELYDTLIKPDDRFSFKACAVTFRHPLTKEEVTFRI